MFRVSPSLKNVESFTPFHRLNSPPGTKSKGFIVKTTPKISVVFRSLDRKVSKDQSAFVLPHDGGVTATPAKMTIALSTFDPPVFEREFEGKRIRLPTTRQLFTVLRSPHVHKKSPESSSRSEQGNSCWLFKPRRRMNGKASSFG